MRYASLLLALIFAPPLAAQEAAPEFEVKAVGIQDWKSVFATVETREKLLARARVGGTVGALQVAEGQKVQAGEKIAVIGDPKAILTMNAAEARIASARAEREQAELDFKRARELRDAGAGTQARLESAKTRFDVAEKTVSALRAEYSVLAQRLAEGAVLAPGAGRVLNVPVADGSVVMAGETIATIAAEKYVLRLHLPERHAKFLKTGDPIQVGERGLTESESLRPGRIVLVYPELDNGRVVADAEVEGLGDYFVGERARVRVSAGERETILVPRDFIRRRFGLAFAKLKSGAEVPVQPGAETPEGIEILAGLRPGDVLVKP